MDPLGATMNIMDVTLLPKWSRTPVPEYSTSQQDELNSSPFPVRADINDKVSLWNGDITRLRATAIVNTTNESLSDKGSLSHRIHVAAGPELLVECRKQLLGCRTGEAKLSEGYNLPARYVIHTVGPRYNTKYRTAAESALFMCYRNVMRIARENKLETLGLCVINTPKRGYPPEDGAHIALRTVRRFLEKYPDTLDQIAFVLEGAEEAIYRKIMPIYFPRNKNEENYVLTIMPKDIGNEEGEPIIPERQIRISDVLTSPGRDDDDTEEGEEILNIQEMHVGQHAFATMQGDHDQMIKTRAQRSPDEMHVAERQRITMKTLAYVWGILKQISEAQDHSSQILPTICLGFHSGGTLGPLLLTVVTQVFELEKLLSRYQRWLRRAHTEDFAEFRQQKMLYQSGVDFLGRPVVVFVARHFNAQASDLSKTVAYFVSVLDRIVNQEYVVVYFHTHSTVENQPPLSFLKDLYHIVDHKYRRHLKAFYIVHPTLWARVVTWFFTTFTASSIKTKVHFISGIQYLYDWMNPDQLDIPAFVLEHDMKENGTNYHTPTSSYRTGSL